MSLSHRSPLSATWPAGAGWPRRAALALAVLVVVIFDVVLTGHVLRSGADLISEGTKEGLAAARARGRTGGRPPTLTARQVDVARGMYEELGADDKRKYTVDEIAETFEVSRKTIYRHLAKDGPRRQPDKTTRQQRITRPTGAVPPT